MFYEKERERDMKNIFNKINALTSSAPWIVKHMHETSDWMIFNLNKKPKSISRNYYVCLSYDTRLKWGYQINQSSLHTKSSAQLLWTRDEQYFSNTQNLKEKSQCERWRMLMKQCIESLSWFLLIGYTISRMKGHQHSQVLRIVC